MKRQNTGYWITTALLAFVMLSTGALDAVRAPAIASIMIHLGYPLYFATLIGVWKFLGGLAVIVPGFPRLKEWAYAGIAFDLSGAAISHAASGDAAVNVAVPALLVALTFASWALRPASRKLPSQGAEAATRASASHVAQLA